MLAPRPAAATRALTALTVLLALVAAASAAASDGGASYPRRPLFPLPAGPVAPRPCPPPPLPPGPAPKPLPPPRVAERAVPLVAVPAPRHIALAAITGKGMWLTVFPGGRLDVPAVIALARRAGLRQLWLRTGSTSDGFYGEGLLRALVAAAHPAGIAVIAWDFPTLSDPAQDARRVAEAVGAGADGFGADIEAAPEGTYLTARRVADYLSLARRAVGVRPLVAIVPRPTAYWLSAYPYRTEASFVDAFAPMVYWSCIEPGAAVAQAIASLAHLAPVVPIGQDYDMASEGGRHGLPSAREIWRFLDVARRDGAIGASLYDLESGGSAQLGALGAYPWPRRALSARR